MGEAAGVRVMDDYAHHPTEVRATLAAARERFPGRRLVCLFQPHTYTRTSYLLDGFRDCFEDCDVLLIARTYAAREEPSAGMDAEQLAREITKPPARYAGELDEAAEAVADVVGDGRCVFHYRRRGCGESRADGAGAIEEAMNEAFLAELRKVAAVRKDEPLSKHVTFGVGGPADAYVVAESEHELRQAYALANSTAYRYGSSAPDPTCSSVTAACAA